VLGFGTAAAGNGGRGQDTERGSKGNDATRIRSMPSMSSGSSPSSGERRGQLDEVKRAGDGRRDRYRGATEKARKGCIVIAQSDVYMPCVGVEVNRFAGIES